MDKLSCDKRKDPVSRLVRDLTPHEVVQWLIDCHGLPFRAAKTVEMNLREQFKYHRLQGRLDHRGNLALLADIFRMRQSAKVMERNPAEFEDNSNVFEEFDVWFKSKGFSVHHPAEELMREAFIAARLMK